MTIRSGFSRAPKLLPGLMLLVACSSQAWAKEAEELQQEGVFRYNTGKYEKSLAVLNQALKAAEAAKAAKAPKLLAQIHLYIGLNQAVIAEQLRESGKDGAAKKSVAAAKKAFAAALTQDASLRLDPNRFKPELVQLFDGVRGALQGDLSATADRPDGVVHIDGKEVGGAPWQGKVAIGPHRVAVLTRDGAYGYAEEVLVAVNKATAVFAQLKPLRPLPIASSKPAAAPTPPLTAKPTARPIRPAVKVKAPVVAPASRPATVLVEAPGPRPRIWTWVAVAGAGVAAIAAIGLGTSVRSDHDEYTSTQDPRRFDELEQSIPGKVQATNAIWGVAGVLAATSVVLFFAEGRPSKSEEGKNSSGKEQSRGWASTARPRLVPVVGQAGGGGLMSWRF